MNNSNRTGAEHRIGKEPSTLDDEQPDDETVAAALGMDIEGDDTDLEALLDQLDDCEVDPVVTTLLETLVDRTTDLQATVAEQQETIEDQRETITDLAAKTNDFQGRLKDVEEQEEKTRDIARSAIAKAEQTDADPDQQEDAEQLPAGVEPSTSPLDFFANCREQKVKELYVERLNRQNTYRALKVAKRWPEFATKRTDGSGVFMTRDDIDEALTAILNGKPHRQTVTRVWEKLVELGGDDLVEKRRRISRKQDPQEILSMDIETAERLLEKRYIGMDLLEGSEGKATTGGVTPVVTGGPECSA